MRDETEHHSEAQIVADALAQEMILNDNPSRRLQRTIFEGTITAEKSAIETLRMNGTITRDEAHYYNRFIDLNDFTADQRLWKNLWLRFRFSFNMGRMYKAFNEAQNAFLTTPLNLEPIYWKRQFAAHGEDLLPIEQAGYTAVMRYLQRIETIQNRSAVNTIGGSTAIVIAGFIPSHLTGMLCTRCFLKPFMPNTSSFNRLLRMGS